MSISQTTAIPIEEVQRGGIDPSDVIGKVKWALTSAQIQAGKEGLGFDLESIALELSVVQTRDLAGGITLKIPWVNWDLGFKRGITDEQTQKISIELEVPTGEAAEEQVAPPIDIPLTQALLDIARIIKVGKASPPALDLKGANVELQFVCTETGELTLLTFEGKTEAATTHKLTVNLK